MEQKIKLLYVDDEELNRQLFQIHFAGNYEVYVSEGGVAGLSILEEVKDILIVISDMKMPHMSGVEFVTKAKELFPDKKFYILTGFEITSEIKAALESGIIINYFNKPFNITEINTAIDNVVKGLS